MGILTFFVGFISIFNPPIFTIIFILSIVLSNINLKKNNLKYLISIFCTLLILFYGGIGFFVANFFPFGFLSSLTVRYLFAILKIILGLWILGFYRIIFPKTETSRLFISFIIGIIWILCVASSFSSTGPILFSVAGSESIPFFDTGLYLMLFALGLTLPLWLITFFATKIFAKYKNTKWMNLLQLLVGIFVIVATLVGLFLD